MGRTAFGVRILNMGSDDNLIGIARQPNEQENGEDESVSETDAGSETPETAEPATPENPIAVEEEDDGLEIY